VSLGVDLKLLQVRVYNLLATVGALRQSKKRLAHSSMAERNISIVYPTLQTYEGGWLRRLDGQSIWLNWGTGSSGVSLAMFALNLGSKC